MRYQPMSSRRAGKSNYTNAVLNHHLNNGYDCICKDGVITIFYSPPLDTKENTHG